MQTRLFGWISTGAALAALAWVGLLLLYVAAAPIATEDFWWHLKTGETYWREGLWPAVDPMLHTPGPQPSQHEWLFGAFLHGWTTVFGLHGARVLHAGCVAGLCVVILRLTHKYTRSWSAAAVAVLLFAALSLHRLQQLRPDLPTMLLALGVLALVLKEEKLGQREVVLASLGLWIWANVHSLFLIGPALLAAGLLGVVVEESLKKQLGVESNALGRARPMGLILLAGGLLSLLNPRGWHQHLTFFSFSSSSALWSIQDEWTPFNPFSLAGNSSSVLPLGFYVTDALLVLFPLVFVLRYVRFRATPSAENLELLAPRLFLPAAAALGAILISSRFLWMGIFPIVYVLKGLSLVPKLGKVPKEWLCAAVAALVAVLFLGVGGVKSRTGDTPPLSDGYFTQAYNAQRYPDPGIEFLRDAGLEGNLFNLYSLGGYTGYRLSPAMKTFVDGRTEHFTQALSEDYHDIVREPSPRALTLLDFYKVDVFFGFGGALTGYKSRKETLQHLRGAQGWIPIFRSHDHSLYLRQSERNQKNLEKISEYYKARAIPFDAATGFQASDVLASNLPWAIEKRMVPKNYAEILNTGRNGSGEEKRQALKTLAAYYRALDDRKDFDTLKHLAVENKSP